MNFFDAQSEQVVIASILLKEENLLKCRDEINDNFFYSKLLKVLYTIILSAYEKHHSILVPVVLDKLLKKSEISVDIRRKYSYLIDKYQKKEVSDIEFKMALDSVKENYLKRRLIDTMSYITQKIETDDANSIYSVLEDTLVDGKLVLSQNAIIKEGHIQDTEERLKLYDDIRADPNKYTGIPSGIIQLDSLTGGFQPGELILIAGKQGSGKSILLMNFGYNAWMYGKNVVYFTLEMPKIQIERRFDARATAMTYYKIKTQQITESESSDFKTKLNEEMAKRKNIFYIVDMPKMATPMLIESKVKQLQKKFNIDIILIDYMSLMSQNSKKHTDAWESTLSIANDLKFTLARASNIPVVTPVQITSAGIAKKDFGDDYDISDLALTRRLADPCDTILGLKTDLLTRSARLNIIKYRDGMGPGIQLMCDFDRCLFQNVESENNT